MSLKPETRQEVQESHVLKMSMCGPDSRLVATIGDWTWDYAAKHCGVDVFRSVDQEGRPSYLAFSYLRLQGNIEFPVNSFAAGDRVTVRSSGFRPSSDSLGVIHRIWREGGSPPRVNARYRDLILKPDPNCVTVETLNQWLVRARPGDNRDLVHAVPSEFRNDHLASIPRSTTRETGTGRPFRSFPLQPEIRSLRRSRRPYARSTRSNHSAI